MQPFGDHGAPEMCQVHFLFTFSNSHDLRTPTSYFRRETKAQVQCGVDTWDGVLLSRWGRRHVTPLYDRQHVMSSPKIHTAWVRKVYYTILHVWVCSHINFTCIHLLALLYACLLYFYAYNASSFVLCTFVFHSNTTKRTR